MFDVAYRGRVMNLWGAIVLIEVSGVFPAEEMELGRGFSVIWSLH